MVPENFYPLMLQHLADNFFEKATMLGKPRLERIIEQGIIAGGKYGLETRYEYTLFIDVAVKLGYGFDTDPQLLWVSELLTTNSNPTEKMDQLFEKTLEYESSILEDEQVFPISAYTQLVDSKYDVIEASFTGYSQEEFLLFLNNLWPQKFLQTPPKAFDRILDEAKVKAKKHGINSRGGVLYFVMAMFMFGHHFDTDKQYIWISNMLTDPLYVDEQYKLSSLHFTIQKLLEALLEEPIPDIQ
jgi:hypothetical protein